MEHSYTTSTERGQVGIGTLIVFIAMVLVAAIAAGVLINTAGMLQSQAEATGEETIDLVSERIDTGSAVGIVADEEEGEIGDILVTVSRAPGSDQIDLNRTVVIVNGPGGQEVLSYEQDDVDNPDQEHFAARDIDGGTLEPDNAVLSHEDRQYQLVFDGEEQPFADSDGNAFGQNDEVTLDIVSPSGAVTSVHLSAPSLLNQEGQAVRL
ncbi:archaellin/type IV pilin N-terminal domain-containing protein [Natrarchaeobaculum aegyptiacum]|uniref:Flagellin n=1 Tax=Natrarchaeobaculum aegyptiacum TaxID=745377 RepID=A0A2Z2HZ79_9EURY|nr:archaellin/type IV pilin N-terminal domain-containing protein [Natrarchaeobaculum aegyptiacum]ARS88968.1 flagellin [Natrarchaeobaculum aegyptiacum]